MDRHGVHRGRPTLVGPALLDYTVNGRPLRRAGQPDSNRSHSPAMAPHGIYPAAGDDNWVAIACRDDADWAQLVDVIAEPWADGRARRHVGASGWPMQDALDARIATWTGDARPLRDRRVAARRGRARGRGGAARRPHRPRPGTAEWGLWPTVHHREMGDVRVDGVPVHLSETDWTIERGGPCLGEHND